MGKLNQVDSYRYDLIIMALEEEFPSAHFHRDSIGLFVNIPWPPDEFERLDELGRYARTKIPPMNVMDVEIDRDCIIRLYLCGARYARSEVPISDPGALEKVFDFLRAGGLK